MKSDINEQIDKFSIFLNVLEKKLIFTMMVNGVRKPRRICIILYIMKIAQILLKLLTINLKFSMLLLKNVTVKV